MAKRILIVDDEIDVLEALARSLKIAGYSVEKALSARDALSLCADHAFDLVIVDFIMPETLGLELINQIRGKHPTIRSIVVSGKIDPKLEDQEVEARLKSELEADAYFSKPVKNALLLDAIARLLGSSSGETWKSVAERVLNAQKTKTRVKKTEKSLRPRSAKKKSARKP